MFLLQKDISSKTDILSSFVIQIPFVLFQVFSYSRVGAEAGLKVISLRKALLEEILEILLKKTAMKEVKTMIIIPSMTSTMINIKSMSLKTLGSELVVGFFGLEWVSVVVAFVVDVVVKEITISFSCALRSLISSRSSSLSTPMSL